jgi:hypothetical protein
VLPLKKHTTTCHTTCLTKVSWTLRVPGYHHACQAS